MEETIGKTARLLNRLPHFYNPEELEKTFLGLYQSLGFSLESCERSIFEVAKAHHVQTAENVGSKGYVAPANEHGDLDKLFSLYLESLGGTSQLISMNPLFSTTGFDVEKLLSTLYLSKEEIYVNIQELLLKLDADADPVDSIKTFLPINLQFTEEEINGDFVFDLMIQTSPITKYIVGLLRDSTREFLLKYNGKGVVSTELKTHLKEDLNEKVLKDPFLFRNNYNYFNNINSATAIGLKNSLNKEFLKKQLKKQFEEHPEDFGNNRANLNAIILELEYAEQPSKPVINDIIRLNRLLINYAAEKESTLDKVWPFKKVNMLNVKEVRVVIKNRINKLLSANINEVNTFFDSLLYSSINGWSLEKLYKDDSLMLRRHLLESIFPYEVKHIYRLYQERLQALIKVLRKGASTKQGIKDIVAANFGMVGNTPEMAKAKKLIQIKEFDPVEETYANELLPLFHSFTIFNDNQDATIPKIKVTMLNSRIKGIKNIKIIDRASKKSFTVPLIMKAGDTFLLQEDGVIFNGVLSTKKIIGNVHALPARKEVNWEVDAEILSNTKDEYGNFGKFGTTKFNDAIFINEEEPLIRLEVLSNKLAYGAFSINIPWHIDGVTDNFAETKDHPRHKIKSLVNKVKAAGVRARVSYLQNFNDVHEFYDQLNFGLHGKGLAERMDVEDNFAIDSRLGQHEEHELGDNFRASGVFGYTKFGSGNTFG